MSPEPSSGNKRTSGYSGGQEGKLQTLTKTKRRMNCQVAPPQRGLLRALKGSGYATVQQRPLRSQAMIGKCALGKKNCIGREAAASGLTLN